MNLVPRKFFLDDFFDDVEPSFRGNAMKCDIYEEDGKYIFEMDVPGYNKEDITIDCDNGYLTVTASKEHEEEVNEKNYIRRERTFGKNVRQFYLGDVDESSITAEFKNGILKVVAPKKQEIDTKKKIEII